MAKTLEIGTVSHGTMITTDLLDVFLDTLRDVDPVRAKEYDKELRKLDRGDDQEQEIVNELFDVLGEYTPDFCYFGAIEGDGSDYGCWISWDSVAEGEHDGDVLRDRDLADDTSNPAPYFLDVSDHGNATLYARKRNGDGVELVEIWAVV